MKRGKSFSFKRININLSNRVFYTLVSIEVLLLLLLSAYALASSIDTSQPYHEGNQVSISINGVEKTLQEAIDNGDLGGSGDITDVFGGKGIEVINSEGPQPNVAVKLELNKGLSFWGNNLGLKGCQSTGPGSVLKFDGTGNWYCDTDLGHFGSWVTKDFGTTYTATTDGFVVIAVKMNKENDDYYCSYSIYTPADTLRQHTYANHDGVQAALMSPVRKGDTWKAEDLNGCGGAVYWISILP